jgi:hypothetical protein
LLLDRLLRGMVAYSETDQLWGETAGFSTPLRFGRNDGIKVRMANQEASVEMTVDWGGKLVRLAATSTVLVPQVAADPERAQIDEGDE